MTRTMRRILLLVLIFSFISFNAPAEEFLEKHVKALSSDIGKRSLVYYQNLELAADYIRREFKNYGYEPETQTYYVDNKPFRSLPLGNIIAVKEGMAEKDKIIVVYAHYDTFEESPGADDNASGVAAVLELARRLRNVPTDKTVKFILFSNEETDLIFKDNEMGSYKYAEAARKRGDDIEAAICIDMIGYFSDEPGSQKYPVIFKPFFPDKGNFIGIGGDLGSYDLVKKTVDIFKEDSSMPVEYLIMPVSLVPQLMTSDNRAFWTFGYKSVWITDTCIYRNPYMHTVNDLYDTLDYKRMSEVVDRIYKVVLKLAQ